MAHEKEKETLRIKSLQSVSKTVTSPAQRTILSGFLAEQKGRSKGVFFERLKNWIRNGEIWAGECFLLTSLLRVASIDSLERKIILIAMK